MANGKAQAKELGMETQQAIWQLSFSFETICK